MMVLTEKMETRGTAIAPQARRPGCSSAPRSLPGLPRQSIDRDAGLRRGLDPRDKPGDDGDGCCRRALSSPVSVIPDAACGDPGSGNPGGSRSHRPGLRLPDPGSSLRFGRDDEGEICFLPPHTPVSLPGSFRQSIGHDAGPRRGLDPRDKPGDDGDGCCRRALSSPVSVIPDAVCGDPGSGNPGGSGAHRPGLGFADPGSRMRSAGMTRARWGAAHSPRSEQKLLNSGLRSRSSAITTERAAAYPQRLGQRDEGNAQ